MEEPISPPMIEPPGGPDPFKPVSRRVATFWNMVFAYTFIALVFVRTLVLIPLYLRYISDAVYGAWVGTGQVLGYLMTDFGLLAVLLQQVAMAYGQGDRRRLERLMGIGLVISLGLTLVMTAVGIGVSPIIPRFFPTLSSREAADLTKTLIISAVANGAYILVLTSVGLLRSLQRPFLSGLMRVLSELLGVVMTIVLLMRGWGLPALGWGLIFRSAAAVTVNMSWLLWIWFKEFRLSLSWAWADAWALWRLSLYQFTTYLAIGLKDSIDPFLIGVMLNPAVTTAYFVTVRASEMVRMIVNQLSIAMLPSLAHLHGEGRKEHYNRIVTMMFQVQTLIAAIGLGGVLIFNEPFVMLWMWRDTSRYAGTAVTVLISIYGLLYLTAVLGYEVLFSMGQFWQLSKAMWLDLVIRLPLMVLLIHLVGAWGATAGSVIGQAIAWNGFLLFLVIRQLGLTRSELRKLGIDTLKLTLVPLALALAFGWIAGLEGQQLTAMARGGQRLQAWMQFSAYVGAYLVIEIIAAVVLAPHLVQVIRRRGRI